MGRIQCWGHVDQPGQLVGSLSHSTFYMLYLGLGQTDIFLCASAVHISLIILGIYCHKIIVMECSVWTLQDIHFAVLFRDSNGMDLDWTISQYKCHGHLLYLWLISGAVHISHKRQLFLLLVFVELAGFSCFVDLF